MKRCLIAALLISCTSSLYSQWYGANDAGISIHKFTITTYDYAIDTNNQNIVVAGQHEKVIKAVNWALGLHFGYQYNQFVAELSGKLNLSLQGDISLLAGFKIGDRYNDAAHPGLSFTPLLGTDLNSFCYGGRVQYDHFIIEWVKMGESKYFGIGFKAYLFE